MKAAVSGARGFVGSLLCRELIRRGSHVSQLSRVGNADISDGSIAWDPARGLSDPEAMEGIDVFFHLAGRTIAGRWTSSVKSEIRHSRIDATQILAEQLASLKNPPQTVVAASATGIYGSRDNEELHEGSKPGDDFLAGVAQEWEAACTPLKEAGIRVVHARISMVLDPTGGALQRILPLFRYGLGGKIGNGKQYWPWISRTDCVRALIYLADCQDCRGPYNLSAPEDITNAAFTQKLASHLRRPSFLPAPKFALKLLMGEMAEALLFSSCRAKPIRLLESGFSFQHSDLESFLSAELPQKKKG